jgi:hypothetical protein
MSYCHIADMQLFQEFLDKRGACPGAKAAPNRSR